MISIHLLNGNFYFDVTPEGLAIINFKMFTLYKPIYSGHHWTKQNMVSLLHNNIFQ